MTTITEVHDRIIDAYQTAFANRMDTIAIYRPDNADPIDTPALLLEMEEALDERDPGDGRLPLRCRFTTHCMLSITTPNVEVEVRELAHEVFRLVRKNLWGIGPREIKVPENLELGQGLFKPGKAGYESWYVTWEQIIYTV